MCELCEAYIISVHLLYEVLVRTIYQHHYSNSSQIEYHDKAQQFSEYLFNNFVLPKVEFV